MLKGAVFVVREKWSLSLKQKFQRKKLKKELAQKIEFGQHFIYKRVCGSNKAIEKIKKEGPN